MVASSAQWMSSTTTTFTGPRPADLAQQGAEQVIPAGPAGA
jgi:hypothetical protein